MTPKEDWNALLTAMTASGALGMIAGIFSGIIQKKHGSFGGFIRGVLASVFVGVLAGWGLADTDLSLNTRSMVIGICSFIADDILLGLMSLATLLGRDPFGFFSRVLSAYRGAVVETKKEADK